MKLISGLIGVFALVVTTLVFAPAAHAAYPGTVVTSCNFNKPNSVRKNKKLLASYSIGTSGNGGPAGKITFKIYRVKKNGDLAFNRALSNSFNGGAHVRSLGKFKKTGKWRVQLVFTPSGGSVYKSCATGLRGFKVKRG